MMLPAKPRHLLLATKPSCVMSAYNPNQTLAQANPNSVALADKASGLVLAVNCALQWHRMSQVTRRTDSCSSIRQNWCCIINPILIVQDNQRGVVCSCSVTVRHFCRAAGGTDEQNTLLTISSLIKAALTKHSLPLWKQKRNQGCSGSVALNDDIIDREAAVREWWCCTRD